MIKSIFLIALACLVILALVYMPPLFKSIYKLTTREEPKISADIKRQALDIAKETDVVKSFLVHYGSCDDCNPKFFKGRDNLIGCVEYNFIDPKKYIFTQEFDNPVVIKFRVSEACRFRYPGIPSLESSFKFYNGIIVAVDVQKRELLAQHPKNTRLIEDQNYCVDGCACIAGSGMPFVGCANYVHAPFVSAGGSYMCDSCECVDNVCTKK